MKLYLRDDFKAAWQGDDPFACVDAIDGQVYRALEGRRTLRFELNGASFFLKSHKGIGWAEIVKNLLFFKLPILGAGAEWRAIQKLQAVPIDTMTAAAFGERGINPAKQESFIITEDLQGSVSLEDYCADWPDKAPSLRLKRALIRKLAHSIAGMHNNGLNHRDCYLCHFHLYPDTLQTDSEKIKLHVIDLHRAQIRSKIPYRWRLKDLAGLYYSAMHIGLSQRDLLYFWQHYCGAKLATSLSSNQKLLGDINTKANALYAKEQRKGNTS